MARLILFLLASAAVFAQDAALEVLKLELNNAQNQHVKDKKKFQKPTADLINRVHAALLAWIESQLPGGPTAFAIKSSDWEDARRKQLASAEIGDTHSPDLNTPAFTGVDLTLTWKPELPGMLFITAGVDVGCGRDEAVYAYRFDANGWGRVISDHTESDWGYGSATIELSDADFLGHRSVLIHRVSIQCGSSWMEMTYSVYRVTSSPTPLVSVFSGKHGFWAGNYDNGRIFVLKPDELIIELLDLSIDGGVHNRTHVIRWKLADKVQRIDPVALQPQDFAEEWLTQPWSEMQSMSVPETQKWHGKFQLESVHGEYSNVAICASKPDRWSISFEIRWVGEKELAEPIDVYLLVRDLGNYRFEMESVSDEEFEGCPGEGSPSDQHPWLSLEQLKALP